MRYPLSERLEDHGPLAFSSRILAGHSNIFQERSALIFTPTRSIPPTFIGRGEFSVFLPICTPDFYACVLIRSYMSPRLWLDLIQQHTGFIRWTPLHNPTVTFTRYDTTMIRDDHATAGIKALRDALKVQTTGRRDGRSLYYFGAILDDDQSSAKFVYRQKQVSGSSKAGIKISVSQTIQARNVERSR